MTLTITFNQNHFVTVALRQDAQIILLRTAGSGRPVGQVTGSVVVSLSWNEAVKVQVMECSLGTVLLASPSIFFSGYCIG